MGRERSSITEPRARYDGRSRGTSQPNSTQRAHEPATLTMPAHVRAASASVMMGWAMMQAGMDQAMGEVDEDELRRIPVTREEARAVLAGLRYEVIGGPPRGYTGGAIFDEIPDTHEAARAVYMTLRCIKYDRLLQERAAMLAQAVRDAQRAADEAAYAEVAPDWQRYHADIERRVNDPRTGGDPSGAIPPAAAIPDLQSVRRAQLQLDTVLGEISAVQRRKDAAGRVIHATFEQMAEAAARLLWIGPAPGPIAELQDWQPMHEARAIIAEIVGPGRAAELWASAEARWKGRG